MSYIYLSKQNKCQNHYFMNKSAFRHAMLMMIIRLAIPTNMKIFMPGAMIVGPFMVLNALEPLCGCFGY